MDERRISFESEKKHPQPLGVGDDSLRDRSDISLPCIECLSTANSGNKHWNYFSGRRTEANRVLLSLDWTFAVSAKSEKVPIRGSSDRKVRNKF